MTASPATTITVCADGPLLVRGAAQLIDADGTPIASRRRTVALCRCGASAIAPWCDGTHKLVARHRGEAK